MRIHAGALESPLPTDLSTALEEILQLRSMLIRDREVFGNRIVRSEEDKRSLRGHIHAANEELKNARELYEQEIAKLRDTVKEYHNRVKNLESFSEAVETMPKEKDPLKN